MGREAPKLTKSTRKHPEATDHLESALLGKCSPGVFSATHKKASFLRDSFRGSSSSASWLEDEWGSALVEESEEVWQGAWGREWG